MLKFPRDTNLENQLGVATGLFRGEPEMIFEVCNYARHLSASLTVEEVQKLAEHLIAWLNDHA